MAKKREPRVPADSRVLRKLRDTQEELARYGLGETLPELIGGCDNAALAAAGELLDAELEAEREKRHALFALKEASIARTIADANAAFKAGRLKPLPAVQRAPIALRVRTPKDVLLSATKPVPAAQVQAYVENHYPGKEQPDFEPLTDAQYAVLKKASRRKHGKAISSIQDMLNSPAPLLQLQLANDFAVLLQNERGQKAVVQYLYNEIGQCTVAALLGAKNAGKT